MRCANSIFTQQTVTPNNASKHNITPRWSHQPRYIYFYQVYNLYKQFVYYHNPSFTILLSVESRIYARYNTCHVVIDDVVGELVMVAVKK